MEHPRLFPKASQPLFQINPTDSLDESGHNPISPAVDADRGLSPTPSDFDAEAWFATPELRAESNQNLLEITVSWEGVILDIGHYQAPRRISFGSNPNADFHFPLDISSDDPSQTVFFPLVEPAKNGFLLCFHPEMEGIVEENGERHTLPALVKQGRAHCFHRNGRCYYPLLPGVLVKFHCKGLEIQIRYVTAPQFSLQWSRHVGTYAPVLSFSVIIHLLTAMFAILSISPPSSHHTAAVHPPTPAPTIAHIRLQPVHLCIYFPKKHLPYKKTKTHKKSLPSKKSMLLNTSRPTKNRCNQHSPSCQGAGLCVPAGLSH